MSDREKIDTLWKDYERRKEEEKQLNKMFKAQAERRKMWDKLPLWKKLFTTSSDMKIDLDKIQ